jgi:hypothetical protein
MTENREPLNLNAFLPPDHTLTIEPPFKAWIKVAIFII